jgi:hypothetical protein
MNVAAAISVTRRTYYSILAELVSAPAPAFAASDNGESASSSHRGRGGNRRVVSQVRSQLSVEFQYDDCMAGLSHAVRESQTSVNRN